jgi:hypothetical protein
LLSVHASEGGSTSAEPPDTEEEDFGDSLAISDGGGRIGSMGRRRGRLAARRRRGNSKKARERVALRVPGPFPFKEDQPRVQRQSRRSRGI